MICTIRIPDVLQHRIDKAAGDDGRSKWIMEACRMRLDGGVAELADAPKTGGLAESHTRVGAMRAGSNPAPAPNSLEDRKATAMQAMSDAMMKEPESPIGRDAMEGIRQDMAEFVNPLCSYREYDQDTGETYGCRLPVHSSKIKHQRGEVI